MRTLLLMTRIMLDGRASIMDVARSFSRRLQELGEAMIRVTEGYPLGTMTPHPA